MVMADDPRATVSCRPVGIQQNRWVEFEMAGWLGRHIGRKAHIAYPRCFAQQQSAPLRSAVFGCVSQNPVQQRP